MADRWNYTVLKGLAEKEDPLGRQPGEALWPDRFSRDDLLAVQALSGRYFDSLYQQEPRQEGTRLFWGDKFKRFDGTFDLSAESTKNARLAWVFDLALGEQEVADYTALALAAYIAPDLYFSNIRRFRLEWPKVKALLKKMLRLLPGDFVFPKHLLEIMAVQELKHEMNHYANRIKDVSLPGDKRARAQVLADRHENGFVHVASGRRGDLFISEHDAFPGETDDLVDISSVATHFFGLQYPFMWLV